MKKKSLFCNPYLPGNTKFYVSADYKDVKTWGEEDCDRVWETLKGYTGSFCPQCEYVYKKCNNCNYARIHGNCFNGGSTWSIFKEAYHAINKNKDREMNIYVGHCEKLIEEVDKLGK